MKLKSLALVATAAALAMTALPTNAAAPGPCDRACLRETLDQFLAAVNAHDPAKAPLAAGFRQTENTDPVKAGEGIWKTAGGLGKVQRRYTDPVSGQAAYFGLIEEPGAPGPALVGMRVKVVGRKVAEAEWVIARKGMALWNPDGLIARPPRADAPVVQQLPRDQLLKIGASYFEGLNAHNGDLVIAKDDCTRLENGTKMTGAPPRARPPGAAGAAPAAGGVPPAPAPAAAPAGGAVPPAGAAIGNCHSGFERLTKAVESVIERRFPVVDTEAGVVMGIGIFHQAPGLLGRDGKPSPTLFLSEFFVVDQAKIDTVYAAMNYLPLGHPEKTGW